MAEPWTDDFAALETRSRHGLRSLDATRASLSNRPQETQMRFFKSHPALSALLAFLILGAVSGAAYAVVREVWVTVDADQSPDQIEHDVTDQLQQQGVAATVHADKEDNGNLRVLIAQTGSGSADLESGLHVEVKNRPAGEQRRRSMRFELKCTDCGIDPSALADTMSGPDMQAVLTGEFANDDDLAAAVKKVLAAHGFANAKITVTDGDILVTVDSAPTASPAAP